MQQQDQETIVPVHASGKGQDARFDQKRTLGGHRLVFAIVASALIPATLAAGEQMPVKGPGAPAPVRIPQATTGDFTVSASPASIRLTAGGTAREFEVGAIAKNGFKGAVTFKLGELPEGVTASPASVKVAAGAKGTITLKASEAAVPGEFSVSVTAASGVLSHESALAVQVTSTPTTASLNTLWFDFGNDVVGNKITHPAVVVTNSGKTPLTLAPVLAANASASFSIVSGANACKASLGAGKSCDVYVSYKPTAASYPKEQTATLALHLGNVDAGVPQKVALTGVAAKFLNGTVTGTNNPQVALYSITLPYPGRVQVNFGETTSYGRKTWWQSTEENHGVISMYVAGMLPNTHYHLQGTVEFNNGIILKDTDLVFKTGAVPQGLALSLTATTFPGMKPSPGIEMTNPLRGLVAMDLQGRTLWTYVNPAPTLDYLQGVKMLPNGDILVNIGALSNVPLNGPLPDGTINEVREIDLAGNTVKEINIDDLNAALSTATCAECQDTPSTPLVLQAFHHEVTPLPNGHWLILSNEIRTLGATTTPPLSGGTKTIIGDVVIDLDENLQPVWVWNEFNHLDPNRHPMGWPDWTHTNAIVYSPDDGDLLISMRHQNWIVKVNYKDGNGDGKILWKLGQGGDFKLKGGADPQDWQYAQHDPGFFSPNTSGVFSLGVMDNGDDRMYPSSNACAAETTLTGSCLYSTIPVFQIDEKEKTATLTFHQKLSPSLYSNFGGDTDQVANGDVEYDLCGLPSATVNGQLSNTRSMVREVTLDASPKTVWSLQTVNANLYRAFRIKSLYPGIQW